MTKFQEILSEVNDLEISELEALLRVVLDRLERKNRVENILDEYIGIGEGIWQTDAQEHINDLRDEDEDTILFSNEVGN